jgi:SAM-dependent methyltransferase
LQVRAGERVLDVAGGAGNTALASARRWADVVCTDYVPDLLRHALVRAEVEGLPMQVAVADAQALPFDDGSFDVVTSSFGVMFAPDQERAAAELLRVLRPGGRLGLASWTPESWVGWTFALAAEYRPLPQGVRPPTAWGTPDGLAALLDGQTSSLATRERLCEFVHRSAEALFDLFSHWFGPTATLMRTLDEQRAEEFRRRWTSGTAERSTAPDGTLVVPSPYLEVVAVKRG